MKKHRILYQLKKTRFLNPKVRRGGNVKNRRDVEGGVCQAESTLGLHIT